MCFIQGLWPEEKLSIGGVGGGWGGGGGGGAGGGGGEGLERRFEEGEREAAFVVCGSPVSGAPQSRWVRVCLALGPWETGARGGGGGVGGRENDGAWGRERGVFRWGPVRYH